MPGLPGFNAQSENRAKDSVPVGGDPLMQPEVFGQAFVCTRRYLNARIMVN